MARVVSVLHREGSVFPGGYSADDIEPWMPGEVRPVPGKVARYLTSTFPGVFVEHGEVTPVSRAPIQEEEPSDAPHAEDVSEPPPEE